MTTDTAGTNQLFPIKNDAIAISLHHLEFHDRTVYWQMFYLHFCLPSVPQLFFEHAGKS